MSVLCCVLSYACLVLFSHKYCIAATLHPSCLLDNGNVMTRSKAFKVLVDKTFESMDIANKGEIDKVELYAGLLMIHLTIAKYAGPAACYVRHHSFALVMKSQCLQKDNI